MDRPGEAVVGGKLPEDVLLVVIEVLVWKTLLLLAEWRVGLGEGVCLERAQIMLKAGGESDMLQAGSARNRLQEVAKHRTVDFAVLGLRGLPRPCREEDVGRVDSG